jgi:threonine/homoserine/homoserine lactone efflux protein
MFLLYCRIVNVINCKYSLFTKTMIISFAPPATSYYHSMHVVAVFGVVVVKIFCRFDCHGARPTLLDFSDSCS